MGACPHLGATRPRVGIAKLGSMPQLGNKKMYCICLSMHRALSSKCRRGDASPPGEDVMPPGEDAILQLGNKKMYSEVIKIMHEYGYMM